MVRLDRDRTPVLFAVVTSVGSGLIVATILNTVRAGMSDGAVLLWFAVTAGGVATGLLLGWALFRPQRRPARAFLLTSAFSQKYFVALFVREVHDELDRKGIDLVLKVPNPDYDASAQSHHLSRLLDGRRDHLGGIVVVSQVQRRGDDLVDFCRRSRLPVVFTDLEPFRDEHDYPQRSAYVGYDTGQLGDLAGKWLAQRLRGLDHPHVLIIASTEHTARQQHCARVLGAELPDVRITVDDRCEFRRSRAYNAVRAHLRQLDGSRRLDAVFCTNDEMALGAVDALTPPTPATETTVVIGIDGVIEATELIKTGRSPLQATVVQDTQRLAVCIVDVLEKLHRGRKVPTRTILDAEIYEAT